MGKKIIWLLVFGLVLRLVIMPLTLHSDFWAVSFSQYFFAFKGIFNIYDFLASLTTDSNLVVNYGQNFFTYPPLAYFTLGIFGLILKPFYNADFFHKLPIVLPVVLSDSRLYWHLFLTKFPYLFFDFGVLVLLMSLFKEEREKFLAAILWIFNPLSFYTSYMIGQFDIIPLFFTILTLYFAKKKRLTWGALSLGIGGAFKMFPLFFVPFLAFSEGKNKKEKGKFLVLGLLPYLLTILPFLNSLAFRQNVLFSNQSQKMLFAKIPVSGAEYLSVFVILYIFLLSLTLIKKLALWKWFFLVLLLFFSVTHYHPQWFLWITPLLIILWVDKPELKWLPIALFFCWFLIMIFFEPSLSISLFAPIFPSLANAIPLSDLFSKFYDVFQFKSIIRSIFAGSSLALSLLLFRKNEIP